MKAAWRARWIFTGLGDPVENGTVETEDGLVTAVHNWQDPTARDLGNMAIIPGLVNAHTHLEFSDLPQPIGPASPFPAWIGSLLAHRRQRTTSTEQRVQQGLRESAAAGVALLGEIATEDGLISPTAAPAVCHFRELLGLLPERIDEQLEIARRQLQGTLTFPPRSGLSPHAPYSIHPELFERLIALARTARAPVMMHLAETPAELELLDQGTGPFRTMLEDFGLWQPGLLPRHRRPLDYLIPLADTEHALIAHGNYLRDDELEFIADRLQMTVVYCPRTHAYFGHTLHPWRTLLQRRDTSVAIGTDSRASNPDLSIWRELCFLRQQFPDVPPYLILQMGTRNGARALGWDSQLGTIEPGRPAALALIELAPTNHNGPWSALFTNDSRMAGRVAAPLGT